MTRLQQEGDEATCRTAHEWLEDALGRYQVTHIHSSIREALRAMDKTEADTSKLPASVQPEDETTLPALLCECGHSRNAHYSGRLSCVHGSKEWCNCEKFVARKDTAMPIETVPEKVRSVSRYTGLTEDQVTRFVGCLLSVGLEIAETSTLSATQRELEAVEAKIDEWKNSNLANWWIYHPRPADFDMNPYTLELEQRCRWLECGISCSREDRKGFQAAAEKAESELSTTQRERDELKELIMLRDTKYLNGHVFGCPRAMTGSPDCYCGFEDDYQFRKNLIIPPYLAPIASEENKP